MDKTKELAKLKKELETESDLPFVSFPDDVVFSDGDQNAEVMFIGEAAGYWEHVKHKPFVGQAGKLLDKMLEYIKIRREDVYITNLIKARPPNNRDPLPEEIEIFRKYLDREIEIIKPKVIVTLGRFSMAKFFPGEFISSIHGKPRVITWHGLDIVVIPMYHPAAALRNGDIMRKAREDFRIIPEVLEKQKSIKAEMQKESAEQMNLV